MTKVVICGSLKHQSAMEEFASKLSQAGLIVKYPRFEQPEVGESFSKADKPVQKVMVMGWTYNHFQWIKQADIVLVFNKGGSCGNSATLEIGYATALGKTIVALEPDDELSRDVLYFAYTPTPEELIQFALSKLRS